MPIEETRVSLGPKFSEGARLLWAVVRERDGNQAAVQREIGCGDGVISRWLYGDVTPRLSALVKVRELYAIPVESWEQKPTRPFKPPALSKTKAAGRKRAA